MNELLESLTEPQQHAVKLLKAFIETYNSRDGTGMFSGVSRYAMLESRTALAAVRSLTLLNFWATLRRSLRVDIPSRSDDDVIAPLWQCENPLPVLQCLATESAELTMLARMLCDAAKHPESVEVSPKKPARKPTKPTVSTPADLDDVDLLATI